MSPTPRLVGWARARPIAALWLGVAVVTAWRLAMLSVNGTDLFVDEAQYWVWSTEPALGYFSKPPLIAWVIGAATWLGGEASPFWIRAAAPVAHGATALLVGLLGARLFSPGLGLASGLAYATLPGVTFGSLVISTDTVMLPFFAGALLLWTRLAAHPSRLEALGLGVCLGLGFLAKYAMAYFVLCAAVLWVARADWRIDRRDAAWAGAVGLGFAALNLGWNLANGAITLAHTAHNAGAASGFPQWDELADFLGAQFGVLGPVIFAAWLAAQGQLRDAPAQALLRWFSLPILLLVCVQALRNGANPNWAAAMAAAATPLAVAALTHSAPRMLRLSFWINGVVAVALPLAAIAPAYVAPPEGRPLFRRVMGQDALAQEIVAMAEAAGAQTILAENRALLAALNYAVRDGGPSIRAPRPDGPPANHFQMAAPLEAQPRGVVVKVSTRQAPEPPHGFTRVEPLRAWTPDAPFFKNRPLWAYRFTFD